MSTRPTRYVDEEGNGLGVSLSLDPTHILFPGCQKCQVGLLLPLSDYGQEGAAVIFKAWACSNPECGFSLRVDKGEVTYGRKIERKV